MAKINSMTTVFVILGAAAGGYYILQQSGKIKDLQEQLQKFGAAGGGAAVFSAAPDLSFLTGLFDNLPVQQQITYALDSATNLFDQLPGSVSGLGDKLKGAVDGLVPEIPDFSIPDIKLLPDLPKFPEIKLPTTQQVGTGIGRGVVNFFKGLVLGTVTAADDLRLATRREYGAYPENLIGNAINKALPKNNIKPLDVSSILKNIISVPAAVTSNVIKSTGGKHGITSANSNYPKPALNTSFPVSDNISQVTKNAQNILDKIKNPVPAF